MTSRKKISVLMAAAECAPFAKVGGLGDVVGSLPQALAAHGVKVSVILPLYGFLDTRRWHLKKIASHISLTHNSQKTSLDLYIGRLPRNPVQYYFVKHHFFGSSSIYSPAQRIPKGKKGAYSRSPHDVERFGFFSKAVVEIVNQAHLPVDIIHCHDWHTALIPTFVDELAVLKGYPFTKTIFTIHNLANQGITHRDFIRHLSLKKDATPSLLEDYYDLDNEQLNCMKLGILSADAVTTVSPTYAKEILTREYSAGLDSFLKRRAKDLSGIINGIDTSLFNPATDKAISRRYTEKTWQAAKPINKKVLQKTTRLPQSAAPVYGLVSRLVSQKGFDILEAALPTFLKNDVQLIVLGSGSPAIEDKLKKMQQHFPEKLSVTLGFDLSLAQKIYAGADFFLMPSRFEPCGLGQLIAMRYGTVPIVRATGGLADTVIHKKTGVVFTPYTTKALNDALEQSRNLYGKKSTWYTMVTKCMEQDYSWHAPAREYLRLYKKII